MDEQPPEPTTATPGRTVAVTLGVALGVGLAVMGFAYAVVAIPIYALAQADRNGLDRPVFRDALFHIALPAGALVGLAVGGLVGAWYRKGGRFPRDRSPF